jgi:hypothetical protein
LAVVAFQRRFDGHQAEMLDWTRRELVRDFTELLRDPANPTRQEHQLRALLGRAGKLNLDSLEVERDQRQLLSHTFVNLCRDSGLLGPLHFEKAPAEVRQLCLSIQLGAADPHSDPHRHQNERGPENKQKYLEQRHWRLIGIGIALGRLQGACESTVCRVRADGH